MHSPGPVWCQSCWGECGGWRGSVEQPPLTLAHRQPAGRWECSRPSQVQTRGEGSELPPIHIFNVLVKERPCSSDATEAPLWSLALCTHDRHATPATPQRAALTAGRAAQTVTDVGMRRAAKCPSLRAQSWMLISISSITCSNTDLSHSRALSLLAFFPYSARCLGCPLGEQGQIVWCLCGSR